MSLFTLIPVGAPEGIRADQMAAVIARLPVIGVVLALPAAGLLAGVEADGADPVRRLLGAILAVGLLAALTGGLHLDGLADTADGLGSRRGLPEALAIMRRPDIGPMGVIALIFTVGVQIAALAGITPPRQAGLGLVVAAVTSRSVIVLVTGVSFPAANPDGLAALTAGVTTRAVQGVTGGGVLAAAALAGLVAGGTRTGVLLAVAAATGLLIGYCLACGVRRILGGLTGDVYGAIIEISTAVVLLVLTLG